MATISPGSDVTAADGPTRPVTLQLTGQLIGGADTIQGGSEDDLLIGGAFGDSIDGDAGNDLIFGDTVQLQWRPNDITDPRFRTLSGTQIYTTPANNSAGADQVNGPARNYRNPDGSAVIDT